MHRQISGAWWAGVAVLAAAMTLAASTAFAQNTGNEFRWQGAIAPGATLEIKGVNGEVRAELASGTSVEVVAQKHARRSDPASVRVDVVQHAGGVTICAVYPTPEGGSWSSRRHGREDDGRPNECAPGDGGKMNVQDNDVQVDFTVRVPAGVRFVGRTVNGGVDARGLDSEAEVYTVNGGVHVETMRLASARTVNGSITATIGDARTQEPLDFETVNGSVTVYAPATLSAAIRAESLNGDLKFDFDVMTNRVSRRRVTGTVGAGGPQLTMRTVNGDVVLRKK